MDESAHQCERARFWASLRLDGELSELEGALLDAHLARCDACGAVASGYEGTTTALRSAPLERLTPVALDIPRGPRRVLAMIAVGAVLLLAVITGGIVRGAVSQPDAAPHVVAVVAGFDTPDQLRALRRTTLLNERRLPRDLLAEPV